MKKLSKMPYVLLPWFILALLIGWAACSNGGGGAVDEGDAYEAEVMDIGDAEALPTCLPEGSACGTAGLCCPQTVCAAGICRTRPARLGETCSPERPCGWLDGICRGGVCACSGPGESCQSNEECCPGKGPCVGGVCAGECSMLWDGPVLSCDEHPCCGHQGLTECVGTCTRPNGWTQMGAPGCLDLVWDGTGDLLPVCTEDSQCCPWLGPCTAGRCGICLVAGSACTQDIDCCGMRCIGGTCAGSSCRHRGESCTYDAECCTPPCSSGRCGCLPPGSSCTRPEECCGGPCVGGLCSEGCPKTCATDTDCCAGHRCLDGWCVSAKPPVLAASCTADVECAGPLSTGRDLCKRGRCLLRCSVSDGQYYMPGFPRCAADSDCCPAMYCDPVTKTCRRDCGGVGASCAENVDCCEGSTVGGTYCDHGVCTRCRGYGSPCENWTQCCSWWCSSGVCTGTCAGIGEVCMSAGDCCDAQALCMSSSSNAPQTCCYPDGHTCTKPDECCGLCDGTVCIPRP